MGFVAALLATIAAIAYAGMVPLRFHPVNEVEWLDPGPGLRFERRSIAYSNEVLRWEHTDASSGAPRSRAVVIPASSSWTALAGMISLAKRSG